MKAYNLKIGQTVKFVTGEPNAPILWCVESVSNSRLIAGHIVLQLVSGSRRIIPTLERWRELELAD